MNTLTIGQYVRARAGYALRSWIGNWPYSEWPLMWQGRQSLAGVSVSEESALTFSPFWSGVCIIATDVASLPLITYKIDANGKKTRFTEHSLYELLHDNPNPEMTSVVARQTMQAHALTYGNAYAEIERDRLGRPVAIWPITPDRVTPIRNDNRRLQYRVNNAGGGQVILDAANMLHVPGLSFNGLYGYDVIEKARESIGLGLAAEQFGASFFGNGSTFGGYLSKDGKLTAEVKAGIRESLEQLHQGVERAHKFAIFGDGLKYTATGVPPNHAQFNETRKQQIEEAARWLTIPQHKINGLDHATFSNIEHLDLEYFKSCLRGWLVRWEQEYNRKLIPRLERHRMFVKHNVEGFLRGDSTARSEFYTKMFNIGVYTINDILEREDMNLTGEEGDVRFVQGNLMPADILKDGPPQKELAPTPVVKQLGPVKEAEVEEEDERSRKMLAEIATRTAAIETGLTAQRDALTAEEREAHAAAVSKLETERANLQLAFDEHREAHAAEVARRAAAEALAAEEAAKRAAADAAVAAAQTERELAIGRAAASDTAAAAALRAKEAADTALAEAQARVTAAETRAAETATLAESATTERATALDEATRARADLDQAVQEMSRARTALADADRALATQREAEAQRLTSMLTAHRALIVHAVGRVVRRETDRARRHQATAEKLRHWMQSFYVTHEDDCLEELRPSVRAILAWKQSAEDVDAVTLALVREHIAESQRQLTAIVDGEPEEMHAHLERMLLKWEQQRPEAVADRLLEQDINHVRSLR